jgi:hypothetical protein
LVKKPGSRRYLQTSTQALPFNQSRFMGMDRGSNPSPAHVPLAVES